MESKKAKLRVSTRGNALFSSLMLAWPNQYMSRITTMVKLSMKMVHCHCLISCQSSFSEKEIDYPTAFVAVVAGLTIGDRSEQNRLIWRLQLAPAVLQNVYVEYFKGLMAFSRFFSGRFAVFKVDGLRPWRKLHLRLFSFTRRWRSS